MTKPAFKSLSRVLHIWQSRLILSLVITLSLVLVIWCWNRTDLNQQQINNNLKMLSSSEAQLTPEILTGMLSRLPAVNQVHYQWLDQRSKTDQLRPTQWFSINLTSKAYPLGRSSDITFQVSYTAIKKSTILTSLTIYLVCCLSGWLVIRYSSMHMQKNFSHIERKARRLYQSQKKHSFGDQHTLSSAFEILDNLLEELKITRSEHKRIDKFFRAQTFLDPDTGIGNRVFFENHLEALLTSDEHQGNGALVRLRMLDLELAFEQDRASASAFTGQFSQIVGQLIKRHQDWIFVRYSVQSFIILIAEINDRDIQKLCNNLLSSLSHLEPLTTMNQDAWLHIGVARFKQSDSRGAVMQEADSAVRAAELQGNNSWFMYESDNSENLTHMGSVRWRTLLETIVQQKAVNLLFQPVMQNISTSLLKHHDEVFLRIKDAQGKELKASVFLPQAQKCGVQKQLEKIALTKLFADISRQTASRNRYSFNLSIDAMIDDNFREWLINELYQKTTLRRRLMFEVTEHILESHLSEISGFLQQLDAMNIHLIVDQVGQFVHTSEYLNFVPVKLLKLHSSIIRDLHLKTENQLFIRSLQGSCIDREIQIFAFGVESEAEWQSIVKLNLQGAQGNYFSQPFAGQFLPDTPQITSRG